MGGHGLRWAGTVHRAASGNLSREEEAHGQVCRPSGAFLGGRAEVAARGVEAGLPQARGGEGMDSLGLNVRLTWVCDTRSWWEPKTFGAFSPSPMDAFPAWCYFLQRRPVHPVCLQGGHE